MGVTLGEFVEVFRFKIDQSSVNEVNKTISSIKSTATKLLGAIGIGFSLSSLNSIAEEFNQINDRISGIVDAEGDAEAVQESILEAANACKTSYSEMASSVESLVNANSELFPIDDATTFVEYVNKVGLAAGYSTSEISSMQSSLQRIVAEGTASSSDITRILRSTPALAKQLADSFGVATDELAAMADAGQLTASAIKEAILASTDTIDAAFDSLDYSISDALLNIRNQWGFFVNDLNSTLEISQTIAKAMVNGFNSVMVVLNKVKDGLSRVNDFLGGGNNLFKLLAISAGAFVAVMAWPKLVSGAKSFIDMLSKIKTSLGIKSLGIAALIAAIVLVALLVEDFINFMQGNDSVIGYAFEKAGIDIDEMRKKVIDIWNNLKTFFGGIWQSMKAAMQPVLDWVQQKLKDVFGEDMFEGLGNGIAGVIEFFERLTSSLAGNTEAQDFIGKLLLMIPSLVVGIKAVSGAFSAVRKIVSAVTGTFTKVSDTIKKVGKAVRDVSGTFEKLSGALKGSSAFSKVTGVFSKLAKAFQFLISPIGIVIAVIAVLAAAFGTLWATSEDFRESITSTFQGIVDKVKGFAEGIAERFSAIGISFDGVKEWLAGLGISFESFGAFASSVINLLKNVWMGFCEILAPVFEGAFSVVSAVLGTVLDVITGLVDVFIGLFTGNWEQAWTGVKEIFSGIWNGIKGVLSSVLNAIKGIVDVVLGWFGTSWEECWTNIKAFFESIWNGITEFLGGIIGGIVETVGSIKDNIVDGIQEAVDWIKALPEQAIQWGKDIIQGIADGITGAISKVTDAVSGVADKIKSFLHFSVPDEGPLTDFESWMPDMMEGLAEGISGSEGTVMDKVKNLAGNIASSLKDIDIQGITGSIQLLGSADSVSASTAKTAAGSSVSNSGNVSQNVNINNTFNGDKAIQQKASTAMDKSADDVTSSLARGLAYAR